jgi:hypothetical protein
MVCLNVYGYIMDKIISGEKRIEYRRICPHWERVFGVIKHENIQFLNGMQKNARRTQEYKIIQIIRNQDTNQFEIYFE